MREWQVAIKALPHLDTCLNAKAESRYKYAMACSKQLKHQAVDVKGDKFQAIEVTGDQSVVQAALMVSETAPVSRRSELMELDTQQLARAQAWLYTASAENDAKRMLYAVGRGQTTALHHYLQHIAQCLQELSWGSKMRRQGVPCRGGRSGVRYDTEREEPPPIAPMATISPSSSSSEDEFLLMRDSYQSFRLRIPRGLLQTDIMVNFTVYLSEAPPINPTGSSPAFDSLHSNEILLGDMQGRLHRMPRPQAPMAHVVQPPQAQHQENSICDESMQEIQPAMNQCVQTGIAEPVHALQGMEGHIQVDEESVIWLPPSPPQQQLPATPSHPS